MRAPFSVQKPEQFLVVILLAYFLALGLQVKHGERTVLGKFALTAFLPLLNGAELSIRTFKEGFQDYIWQKDLALNNEQMQKENLALRAEIAVLKPLENENAKLRALLSAPPPENYRFSVARAIILYGAPFTRSLLLSVQDPLFIQPKSPVIDTAGVVGRIEDISGGKARVTLLTDPTSAIGVMDERSKVHGVAVGEGRVLRVRYVTNEADVREGDLFVTSGEDGVFPPGLPVGRVTAVEDGGDYLKKISLTPSATLESLTWVEILHKTR
ncbi:MAG TPA: rod shape-determining protein MreC [Acidobacteriota bacterium]|nr:rod shape-determining protein MreC [Acidobacteriota bacterium]HNT16782.1 rod shape-determining protein MreC [Acidobacteriota bacterium]HQO19325.1 rod shape-determining protein MreC [Acidobacteriota bacterium]HQQ46494.1 rod shape-determining protein MreC [Acidobacteriota bacterium]